MISLPEVIAIAFLVGMSGALAPGPTLVATVNATLTRGWTAGPRVTAGHMAVEALLAVLVLAGISAGPGELSRWIGGIGGIALVLFGCITIHGSRTAVLDAGEGGFSGSCEVAGALTTVTNPYFWVWWFTVGGALLISASAGGIVFVLAFLAGHWAADLGWYTLVSVLLHSGRRVLPLRAYRVILACCGVFLVGFGLWFCIGSFR